MIDPIRRRTFLGLLGAAGSASALPAFAATANARERVLVDARFTASELRHVPGDRRDHAMMIAHSEVLHWRRELLDFLRQGGSLTAYTRWDLAHLLGDLGREAGRQPKGDFTGKPVMVTLIGPRALS